MDAAELVNVGEMAFAVVFLLLTLWALIRRRWLLACGLAGATIVASATAFALFIENASRGG